VKGIKTLHKLSGPQEHLRALVSELPVLLNLEFRRFRIPSQPIFVPLELNNFHVNLGWEYRHLTDAQWWLLQQTFRSLHVNLDSFRRRRRKPLPADRILFEGILWKLASGLRWQDLQDNYPVRLCQDLYRALYRTGHMQAIYKQLHWHLNVHGEATLDELVERGCFVITGNRVHLSPSEEPTWEKYTALLLLQQACHARRAIQREADLERRRRGLFYRLPPLRLPGFPRRPARFYIPGSPPNIPPRSPSSGILDRSGSTSAPGPSP
jgi:transposase